MSEWKARRFWKEVSTREEEGGHAVLLDDRPVRTPAKAPLLLPTPAMAEAVAAEWRAQEQEIAPRTMPATRGANAAIDKVAVQFDEVATMLSAYGDSDLLCYRADGPAELVERQAAGWDPLLDWAADRYAARLETRQGVMHAPQSPQALGRLDARVREMNAFELAAFHDLVSLSGSLVLGLAAAEGHAPAEELWQLSRIDESWQEEQWGPDEEAREVAEVKRQAFLHAKRFFDFSR